MALRGLKAGTMGTDVDRSRECVHLFESCFAAHAYALVTKTGELRAR